MTGHDSDSWVLAAFFVLALLWPNPATAAILLGALLATSYL